MGVCMQACNAFPLGNDGDAAGNTLGCRSYHAGTPAQTLPTTHCPHAGPSGGTVCGGYCEAYCNLTAYACTGTNLLPFNGLYDTCYGICSNAYNQSGGVLPLDTSGATVQCKIYHASVASNSSANALIHCPHTSPAGEGTCGTSCQNYCYSIMKSCPSTFSDVPTCMLSCVEYPNGTFADQSGNTVECRTYHSGVASISASNAMTHCPHCTPSGATVCGNLCDVYCQLANYSCTGTNAIYTSLSACQTACTGISLTGSPGDAAGNSLYCRIYHLGVAGQPPSSNAVTHCPHGMVTSSVCTAPTSSSGGSTGNAATIAVSILGLLIVNLF